MKWRESFLLGMITGTILAGFSPECKADPGDTWLTLEGVAIHEHEPKRGRYNQNNWSLGAQHEVSADWRLGGAYFKNSAYGNSVIVAAAWIPLHVETYGYKFHAGLAMGGATGYTPGVLPFVLPTVSAEYRNFGIDALWVPTQVFITYIRVKF